MRPTVRGATLGLPEHIPNMPASLVLKVLIPILPERAVPGDRVILTDDGRTFLIRELPANPGRWLTHLTAGVAAPQSHPLDRALLALVDRQTAPRGLAVPERPS